MTQLQNAGADEIMCIMQMGGVPHEAAMETIRQYGQYVIPHFSDKKSFRIIRVSPDGF
ncbi:MAG: hypothetical protein Ct9H90mP5_09380 [Acidimicrobiaceae bacterium]|nr:MAG: hypothetical protein Ct9H90mP5_09380 [Acidimicrobiaceae bacterium]